MSESVQVSEPIQVAPAEPPPVVAAVDAPASQIVAVQPQGPGFLVRAVWFVLVGWWLTAIVISIAYVLCVLIVTLPFGLAMFNRVGAVMTLLRY